MNNIIQNLHNRKTYIIAEIGVNHDGSIEKALRLIDEAVECGADAVKFQSFKTELLIPPDQPKMPYQEDKATESNQFEMLKKLELNRQQHQQLIEHCRNTGIDFISTPYDVDSADMLVELGVEVLKVASTDTTNLPFLRYLKSLDRNIILSTGVTAMDELERVMQELSDMGKRLKLLHCVSNYPCPLEELNLRCIQTYKEKFDCEVGFSDHSALVDVGAYAVCAGATILEKHFTYDKTASGPDHAASFTKDELKAYIQKVRAVEVYLGDGKKRVMKSEETVKKHMQKSLVAKYDLKAGQIISAEELWTMRPATGISPLDIDQVLGKKIRASKQKFEQILVEDLEDA